MVAGMVSVNENLDVRNVKVANIEEFEAGYKDGRYYRIVKEVFRMLEES